MGTYILLFFLVVIWTGLGLAYMALDSSGFDLSAVDPVLAIILPTIIIQWLILLAVVLAIRHESGRISSIGFTRPRPVHLAAALVFMVMSNIVLAALQAALARFGLAISPDVAKMLEQAGHSTWWWLALSITAGICEEACFRGYLLTRLRAVIGRGWVWPVIVATVSFTAGHTYQGWGGLIVIFVYGLMFCALFLMTKSLWPGIFAHIIQDFVAIFIYRLKDF
jgi:membrane protease YdiL (CAAX protease family)